MRISSFIGKPVISPEGAAYGYIKDVRLSPNFHSLSALVCVDAEEEEFYLPPRTVKAAGDAVIVGRARLAAPSGLPSPIGRPVYDCTGKRLGTAADVVLGEDPVLCVADGEKECEIPIRFTRLGETVVAYPEEVKQRKAPPAVKRPAPKKQKAPTPAEPNGQAAAESAAVPLSRCDLLGKFVRRNVFDRSGAPLALEGEKVTPSLLNKARRAGKLLELTVCTITE